MDAGEEEGREEKEDYFDSKQSPLQEQFDLEGPKDLSTSKQPVVTIDDEDHLPIETSAEFLRWHHRMGHISTPKIQRFAKQGILPKRLATCHVPICTSGLFGKLARRQWQAKPSASHKKGSKTLTRPGECVSVDQLESPTPGVIAQLQGIPTKARYKTATVFIDHVSRLSHVHLQKSTNPDLTMEAKVAFGRFANASGVKILNYHVDNGVFADNKFKAHTASQNQTLTFCGVNAHFQNGLAKRRIRELSEHARTMLIHAQTRWPSAITANLAY
jgi:hypothetical protein